MALKSETQQRNGNLVLPGDRLGVIEEFIPDTGTFVKDGVIYSKIIGKTVMDMVSHRVSVQPVFKGAVVPKVGITVIGQVGNAQSDNVLVRILQVADKKKMSGTFGGILHISDVSDRYIDSMNEVCKPGDIIRAKVISSKNQIFHLSMADRNLGVVYGFCSLCSSMLEQSRPMEMHCPKCGNVERRKTSPDYGKEVVSSGA